MMLYNAADWFWIVGGNDTKVYASARGAIVVTSDAQYQAWLAAGAVPTPIDSMENLIDVLRAANIAPYHLVPKRVIVDRLETAGKLDAAKAALDAADLYTQERWNTRDAIYADDPTAVGLVRGLALIPPRYWIRFNCRADGGGQTSSRPTPHSAEKKRSIRSRRSFQETTGQPRTYQSRRWFRHSHTTQSGVVKTLRNRLNDARSHHCRASYSACVSSRSRYFQCFLPSIWIRRH